MPRKARIDSAGALHHISVPSLDWSTSGCAEPLSVHRAKRSVRKIDQTWQHSDWCCLFWITAITADSLASREKPMIAQKPQIQGRKRTGSYARPTLPIQPPIKAISPRSIIVGDVL
jgi:hypothetical protein